MLKGEICLMMCANDDSSDDDDHLESDNEG